MDPVWRTSEVAQRNVSWHLLCFEVHQIRPGPASPWSEVQDCIGDFREQALMMVLSAPTVVQALSPKIAIFSADDVVQSCRANGLKGLQELFKPWENGIEKVSILSSLLTPTVHPIYTLRFTTYDDLLNAQRGGGGAIPYSPEVVVDVVSNLLNKVKPEDQKQYDVLRDILLASSPIAEHETFNHPVCFILATSTSSPDPIQALQRLQNTSLSSPVYTSRPFMDGGSPTSVLRFWLLVHDVSRDGENLERAQQLLQQVKKQFGPQAALLVINSAKSGSEDIAERLSRMYSAALSNLSLNDPFLNLTPLLSDTSTIEDIPPEQRLGVPSGLSVISSPGDVKFGELLSNQDIGNIRGFLRELTSQSLVPWMEARVREWNEVFAASRRGITGRLFGAGRKFFGGGKPAPSSGMGYNTIRGYYPPTSPEAISRRLADFAFMLRDYRLAGTVYDSIRRDYVQDGAIKLGASATEMYGISTLFGMSPLESGSPIIRQQQFRAAVQETESWLEQAVSAYQSRQIVQLDALRATILYYETWKGWAQVDPGFSWKGISPMLVRAAGDAEEAPSAIMLEQAANLDLRCLDKRNRKHAFHLVMAARRYEKSGHKPHSRHCLERAIDYYRIQSPPWIATQDHIEYSLGRQAYTLGQSELAVEHFLRLLGNGAESDIQSGVLEDFGLAYQQFIAKSGSAEADVKFELPCAIFDIPTCSVTDPEADSDWEISRERWEEIEARFGHGPSILPEAGVRLLGVGDRFLLTVTAVNPVNAPIVLSNVRLNLRDDGGSPVDPSLLSINGLDDVHLEPLEVRQVDISITASSASRLSLESISFDFHDMLPCKQLLGKRGKRLHSTKQERLAPTYAMDRSNVLEVIPSRPRLRAVCSGLPETLFEGEVFDFYIELTNMGRSSVEDITWIIGEEGYISLEAPPDASPVIGVDQGTSSSMPAAAANTLASEGPARMLPQDTVISVGGSVRARARCYARQMGPALIPLIVKFRQDGSYHATRSCLSFDVEPLLLASASAIQDSRSMRYVIKTTVANVSPFRCNIGEAVLISSGWQAKQARSASKGSVVQPHQTHQSYLDVVRNANVAADRRIRESEATANALLQILGGKGVEKRLPSVVDLLPWPSGPEDKAVAISVLLSDRRVAISRQLAFQFPHIPSAFIPDIFPLFWPSDLDLAVPWECTDADVPRRGWTVFRGLSLGNHHAVLPLARINASAHLGVRAMYEETNRRKLALSQSILESNLTASENPLEIVTTPIVLSVDESSKYPIRATATLRLRNWSDSMSARYVITFRPLDTRTGDEHACLIVGRSVYRGEIAAWQEASVSIETLSGQSGNPRLPRWSYTVDVGYHKEGDWIQHSTFRSMDNPLHDTALR